MPRCRATPTIPRWIKDFRMPGASPNFRNAFELVPHQRRLYATETLYCDWDAEVLLLAQDAMPWPVFEAMHEKEGEKAWRHAKKHRDAAGWKTNEALVKLVNRYLGGHACLYGSAAAHMLCVDPRYRHRLGTRMHDGALGLHLRRTLSWVIKNMPKLRAVACLGNEAARMVLKTVKTESPVAVREARDRARSVKAKAGRREIILTFHYHPAARVALEVQAKGWITLSKSLGRGEGLNP